MAFLEKLHSNKLIPLKKFKVRNNSTSEVLFRVRTIPVLGDTCEYRYWAILFSVLARDTFTVATDKRRL